MKRRPESQGMVGTCLAVLPLLVAVTGCGGGGADSSPPSAPPASTSQAPSFVSWSDNANGTTIKDGNNANFAVEAGSRAVYAVDQGVTLTGLSVDASANVLDSGKIIGTVAKAGAQSGANIAVFNCSSGARMVITVGATGWSYSCQGAPTTPPPAPPTGGGTQPGGAANGVPAPQCVTRRDVSDGPNKGVWLVNNCSARVEVSFCSSGSGSSYRTSLSHQGNCYGPGAGTVTIQPNNDRLVSGYNADLQSEFFWASCAWTGSITPLVVFSPNGTYQCK